MRFTFQQQVFTGIVVSIALVIIVGLTSYNALLLQQENASGVYQTRDVISTSASVKNLLLTAETNIRGFALTRNNKFETSYNQANERILSEVNQLKTLVRDNPTQSVRLDSLSILVAAKLDLMSSQRDMIQSENQRGDTLRTFILLGKNLSSKIDFNFSRIENTEQALLTEREQNALESASKAKMFIVIGTAVFMLVIFLLYYFIQKTYSAQLILESETLRANEKLGKLSEADQQKNWILTGAAEIGKVIRGEPSGEELSRKLLLKLAKITDAMVAVMYLESTEGERMKLAATYGVENTQAVPTEVLAGQGILGQVLLDKTDLKRVEVAPGYMQVSSSVGKGSAAVIYIKSLTSERRIVGLIEIAFLREPQSGTMQLLEMISENAAVVIMAAKARMISKELLLRTQKQAEELEAQQEQLSVTNQELTKQTSLLLVSEEELRVQQEELRQINSELEEKAFMLEEQKRTLQEAKDQLQIKADELEKSGRFKSEFLANMSHELRTPLNSILILSRILEENKAERLSEEEQRYASVIHNSGADLLTLINDILDLAKVESGKIELHPENIHVNVLLIEIRNTFQKIAENKGLTLILEKDPDCPDIIFLDQVRLLQILRNLLSNAVKFTAGPGKVSLTVALENEEWKFEVKDTGIGIPLVKQKAIFDAFQQADGSTSRKYGGTGLGLSITRELTLLFKGSISVVSEPGEGSVFTLRIPVISEDPLHAGAFLGLQNSTSGSNGFTAAKSSEALQHRLLLIEDDPFFAADISEKARNSGFQVETALTGKHGLALINSFMPTAIILDMHLPDVSGEDLLRKLKSDPNTRLIPVHTVSAGDETSFQAAGAIGFMQKPLDRKSVEAIFDLLRFEGKNLSKLKILLVEDDTLQSKYVGDFLTHNDIHVLYGYSGAQALDILSRESVDGIILDIRLTDMNGLDFLEQIKRDRLLSALPVIINTAEDLSQADLARIMKYAHPVVMKTRKSNERLLDEVKLFLKRIKPESLRSASSDQNFSNPIVHAERVFFGRKVLLADDDMRNIFAMSAVLDEAGFLVIIANNGREAIEKLNESPDIEIVLMDVMMPEMDGVEATRAIRKDGRWASLPIIAVTAKAMQGDREQCMAAGANDYISKPIDVDKLLSLIKVWLYSA